MKSRVRIRRLALKHRDDDAPTVLVVEDESEVRELVCEVLRREGYEVLTAENGTQGIRVAEAHKGPIRIVLTDLVMPEIGGLELADRLRILQPDIKVLLMSGYDALQVGGPRTVEPNACLLEKPFPPKALIEKVQQMLEQKGAPCQE